MTPSEILSSSLKQLDFPQGSEIWRYGCYAWVLAMAAQLKTGDLFSLTSFTSAVSWGKRDGAIGDDMYLAVPERWLEICFEALHPGTFRVWQVGTEAGWFAGAKWYRGPMTPSYSFLAMRWQRPNGDHWTYYDPYASLAWDPHGQLSSLIPSGHHRFLIQEV